MSAPGDLTTLADVQAHLGQSGDAALLSTLISQVSRAILSSIGREDVLPRLREEVRDGDGHDRLILRHWPAVEMIDLEIDGRPMAPAPPPCPSAPLGIGWLLESADGAPPGRMQRLSLRGARFTPGLANVRIRYVAGYLAQDEARVPEAPGPYVIAARQRYGAWREDAGVLYANGVALSRGAPARGVYSVADGAYAFDAADAGARIVLRYGYVPFDLAEAALEWTAERYVARGRIGQRSKSLGGQETVSYDIVAMPGFVASLLQPYRRTVWPC